MQTSVDVLTRGTQSSPNEQNQPTELSKTAQVRHLPAGAPVPHSFTSMLNMRRIRALVGV